MGRFGPGLGGASDGGQAQHGAEIALVGACYGLVHRALGAVSLVGPVRMDYEKVRQLYGDEERMDDLRNKLLARKVMAFLLANAETTEEEAAR